MTDLFFDWKEYFGNTLPIRARAKASENKIKLDHRPDGTIKVRVYVTTVPEKGKSNQAILKLLAKEIGLPPSALTITHGHTGKEKIIHLNWPE